MHMYIINVIVVRNLLVLVNLVNMRVSLSCCRVMAIRRLTVNGAALDFVNNAIMHTCFNLTLRL